MKSFPYRLGRLAAEPFRVFFPLGIFASFMGVLVWPAVFHGWIPYYPLEAHMRWMVLGFAGCFITGFLGTAGPRLLGANPWSRGELLLHTSLALTMMGFLAMDRITAADLTAGLWLLSVLVSLLTRFVLRNDVPPPGLPLAALGLAGAAVSGIILGFYPAVSIQDFLRLLYFQGLLWLPILGAAPYLLPRFFGKKSLHTFPEGSGIPEGWIRPFFESLVAGLLLMASFAIEAWKPGPSGMILRASVVLVHLARSVPGLVAFSKTNALGIALRWVLPCSIGGWLLAVCFAPMRAGMLHLMFIGGAGLLMICSATRIILGHNERHDRLASPLRWFHFVWGAVIFTAATRLTADFILKVRVSHLTYAAVLWILVLAFWIWKLCVDLKQPHFEQGAIKTKCPRRKRRR